MLPSVAVYENGDHIGFSGNKAKEWYGEKFEDIEFEGGDAGWLYLLSGFILLQYIGLSDANNTKLHEGDILASTIDEMLLKWVVVFKNGCFGIRNIGIDGYQNHAEFYPCNSEYFFKDRVKIGNIHSHPELVKSLADG